MNDKWGTRLQSPPFDPSISQVSEIQRAWIRHSRRPPRYGFNFTPEKYTAFKEVVTKTCFLHQVDGFTENEKLWYFHPIAFVQHLKRLLPKFVFDLPYSVDHIPTTTAHNRRPGTAMTPEYLTIHSTDNLRSSARNERSWLTNSTNTRTASFHVVVDEKEAIECIPFNEKAIHAYWQGNRKSIGLEICESGDRAKTRENAVLLSAKILRDYNWDISKLKRHYDWPKQNGFRKNCPQILILAAHQNKAEQTWDWFKSEVKKLLQ